MNTLSGHVFVSNIILQQKEPRTLWEMADSRSELRNLQMSLEHVAVPRDVKCSKTKQNKQTNKQTKKWGYVQEIEELRGRVSSGQSQNNSSDKMNNAVLDYNQCKNK